MPVDERIKRCNLVEHLPLNACHALVYALDELDEQMHKIWRHSDDIEKVSKEKWGKLDKAYNNISDARGWIRDVIGDVE